jgi:two-component system NarL family sensor kinase
MSTRTATWMAWSLGILWAVLLALTFLFFTLNLLHPGVEVDPLWFNETVVSVSYPAIGLLLASRRPEHPIGWLFCAAGLTLGLEHFCSEYAIYALLAQPGSLPAGQAAAWVSAWVWVPFAALCAPLVLLFPDGRLPSRRWLPFAWLVGIATVALATVAALRPGPVCEVCPMIENPLGIEALEGVSALDFALMETLFYVLGLPAMASLYLRFRRASSVERQQIKWFAYAGSVVVLAAICRSFLGNIVHSATGAWCTWWLGQGILTVGFAGTAIAMGIAILKYRLYEIDTLINRTLVYGSLTVLLAAVYFGGVATVEAIFRALIVQEEQPQLAIVVSTSS